MKSYPISALRSVVIGVPDVAAAERFYVDVWGLAVSARDAGAVLRGTGADHHLLALVTGEARMHSATYRVRSDDALGAVLDAALREGATLVSAPGPASDPAGGISASFRDPGGLVTVLVHGDATLPPLAGPQGSRPVRLAHINVNTTDVDAATRFFEAALGFRMTDRSKLMSFVSTGADHHAVVIAQADRDGLNHISFLVPDVESVMRASGRMIDHGWPIGWGVGRHGPGDNVFAYFVGPAGYVIEYTAEVLQVDESYVPRGPADWVWPPGRVDQWGIAPPKPDHVKHAQLAIPFAQAAEL